MSKLTRRDFIYRSLFTTTIAPSTYCLAALEPAKRPSPNERVGVAVVGVGGRGRDHLSNLLLLEDVEVVAICDVNEKAAHEACSIAEKKSGKRPRPVTDYRKLLEDKSIQAVSIATPNHWHTLQAIWALQAGKDAYVEKPISHNVWEGRQLVEATRKSGRVVTQGSQRRSWPSHIAAINFLHAGKLGKLKRVHGICYKPRGSIGKLPDAPVPAGVDYDLWLGPAPQRPFNPNRFYYNWHWHWDYGNGDLGNTGVHDMDIIVWGIQKKELPSRMVSAGGRFGYEDQGETPNTQIVALDYGDLEVTYEVRGLKAEPYFNSRMAAIFHCSEGTLVVANGAVAAFDLKDQQIHSFGERGPDLPHFRNFVDAVKRRNPAHVRVSVQEAHFGSSFCHLPNISYRLGADQTFETKTPFGNMEGANECFGRVRQHLKENGINLENTKVRMGRTLNFVPATEKFKSEPEADQLLTRDYRKPFVVPSLV